MVELKVVAIATIVNSTKQQGKKQKLVNSTKIT